MSPHDLSASDSPNSSVSDRARDSIISTQRLLPYSTPPTAAAELDTCTSRRSTRRRCPRDVTLPSNLDNDALVWSTVTSSGGRVTLPGSGEYWLHYHLYNKQYLSNIDLQQTSDEAIWRRKTEFIKIKFKKK